MAGFIAGAGAQGLPRGTQSRASEPEPPQCPQQGSWAGWGQPQPSPWAPRCGRTRATVLKAASCLYASLEFVSSLHLLKNVAEEQYEKRRKWRAKFIPAAKEKAMFTTPVPKNH